MPYKSKEDQKKYLETYRKTYNNKRVNLTFTPKEYKHYKEISKIVGLSVPQTLKKLLHEKDTRILSKELDEKRDQWLKEIRSLACNVNQISKNLNTETSMYGLLWYKKIDKILTKIDEDIVELNKHLENIIK